MLNGLRSFIAGDQVCAGTWALFIGGLLFCSSVTAAESTRPNVLLIMTDDQGFGDIGVNGNQVVQTPTMDRLARSGIQHTRFYVSPVCTPTRASLMTGRYNYRTRAIDTYIGRAMMDPQEVTIAEMLAPTGYATGIFGKWHLGDNYPLRACDQGFQESLVHRGGGLAQPAGQPGETYFNPELLRNGEAVPSSGYCTDIFADAAIDFIRKHNDDPWFVYLAFNAPHDPLQVPDEELSPYEEKHSAVESVSGSAEPAEVERTTRVYAMVSRVDKALEKLFQAVDDSGNADNTLIIFLTDNGPAGRRYNAGMRGAKGSVYEGGIHVPCFVRWPARLEKKHIDAPVAHIDLAPTILAACGVTAPETVKFDGVNLLPLWEGKEGSVADRTLFFQWHRGNVPERYRAFAARGPRYKLVRSEKPRRKQPADEKIEFELFDLENDPAEKKDLSTAHPEIVKELRDAYDRWFDDVSSTRGYAPPRIVVGTDHENPVRLTRQDWRGEEAGWNRNSIGHWEIEIAEAGKYRVAAQFLVEEPLEAMEVHAGDKTAAMTPTSGEKNVGETKVELPAGPFDIWASGKLNGKPIGPGYLFIERVKD